MKKILTLLVVLLPFSAASQQAVTFAEPNLAAAIRARLDLAPDAVIYDTDLADPQFTGLTAYNAGIADLSGLEYCVNLEGLRLDSNEIRDLSPLAGLMKLERLCLDDNRIVDVAPLSHLESLRKLDLSNNEIETLAPLSDLPSLYGLGANDNRITDLGSFSGMRNIEDLRLNNNKLTDISALEFLTDLVLLDLEHNLIQGIEPLVANESLGDGLRIFIGCNDLTQEDLCVHLTTLRERGVGVNATCGTYIPSCPPTCAAPPRGQNASGKAGDVALLGGALLVLACFAVFGKKRGSCR